MRRVNAILIGALVVAASWPTPARAAEAVQRLRCLDKRVSAVLQDGLRRSPAMRDMVARIERSDLIVYLTAGPLPPDRSGATRLLASAAGFRFVHVTINALASAFDLAARLGHELQHVLEIADAGQVHDNEGMRALYSKIGWRASGKDSWETEAAVERGHRVLQEMYSPLLHVTDVAVARPGETKGGQR